MAFNVGNYVSTAVKAPVQRIVDGVIGQVSFGLQQSVTGVAGSMASSLFNVGQSYASTSSIAALNVDNIVAGGDNHYTAPSGSDIAGNAGSSGGSSLNSGTFSRKVSPQGVIEAATEKDSQTFMVYPPDIGRYKITLNFQTYVRPAPFEVPKTTTNYSVTLPIPAQLRETYSVDYRTPSLNLVGDLTVAHDSVGSNKADDAGVNTAIANVMRATHGINSLTSDITTVVEQYNGIAPNPNISVAFDGPKLRSHAFSWTFAPRSADESRMIQTLIANVRKRILPKASYGNITSLLHYPDMVEIKLAPEEFYEFKRCMVTDVDVVYSPNGIPSFFKGTHLPTFISFTLHLIEIEYFLSEEQVKSTTTAEGVMHDVGKLFHSGTEQFKKAENTVKPLSS